MLTRVFAAALICCAFLVCGPARGQAPAPVTEQEEHSEAAKAAQAFAEGTEHAREARWAQALASFERAAEIRPHAITTYNIGTCERALGMYVRARKTFNRALAQHRDADGQLPEQLIERARGFLGQIDQLLVRLTLRVNPNEVAISIDGRPLERIKSEAGSVS